MKSAASFLKSLRLLHAYDCKKYQCSYFCNICLTTQYYPPIRQWRWWWVRFLYVLLVVFAALPALIFFGSITRKTGRWAPPAHRREEIWCPCPGSTLGSRRLHWCEADKAMKKYLTSYPGIKLMLPVWKVRILPVPVPCGFAPLLSTTLFPKLLYWNFCTSYGD